MWQRIQTLYMAISTILTVVMLISDIAVIYSADGVASESFGFAQYLPFLILLIVILLLDIIALAAYKFLVFQMRTASLAALITLALQIWVAVVFFSTPEQWVFKIPAVFPAVCVILDILAARAIMGDKMIVESASSLRKSRRERRRR